MKRTEITRRGTRAVVVRWRFVAGGMVVGASLFATTPSAKPDVVAGEKLFATCAACHAPEMPTKTGPDLRGVFGRRAGTVSGFRYSRALKSAGIVWDDVTLDAFLAEPQAALPGNAMPFPGLPDAQHRLDLIAYLKTLK
jgi:cytochrome c